MAQRWEDVDRFAVDRATEDLAQWGEVHPLLVAFSRGRQCFLAFLRPFPKGEYADPMIELLSLAMPLDADQLAFAAAGRLTSLADPIPPVTDEADLRQRALVVEHVDGSTGPARHQSTIHPFDLDGSRVVWGEPVRLTGGQGWISGALQVAVNQRSRLAAAATDADIRSQAERCVALGHDLYLGRGVNVRLCLPRAASPRPPRRSGG